MRGAILQQFSSPKGIWTIQLIKWPTIVSIKVWLYAAVDTIEIRKNSNAVSISWAGVGCNGKIDDRFEDDGMYFILLNVTTYNKRLLSLIENMQ